YGEFVGRRTGGVEGGDRARRGGGRQKHDHEALDLLIGSEEGGAAGDRGELAVTSQEDGDLELELPLDLCGDEGGESPGKAGGGAEDHVAALDVGRHVGAAGPTEHGGEILHGQAVLAADVDTAEQRGVLFVRLRRSSHASRI